MSKYRMEATDDTAGIRRGDQRRSAAHRVIDRLDRVRRWSVYGRPVLVGTIAP